MKKWLKILLGILIGIILIIIIFLLLKLNKVTFSETKVMVKDSGGNPVEGIKLDIMYYCEDGYSIKIFGVTSGETNDKGEILFSSNEGGRTFKDKQNCRKTLTLLDNNKRFEDGGVTHRINSEDIEEEVIIK